MKIRNILVLAGLMFVGSFFASSCRSTHRTISLWPGDRNVTTVKKPKRKKIKGRKKMVRTTKWNRAHH